MVRLTMMEIALPSMMPSAPPTTQSSTASSRNWRMISCGRAPTAMRRPISLVRSVTETSMIFMMPTPPTTREIMATIIRRLVITSVVLLMARDISAMSHTRKSSSWPSLRLCLARITSVIWSMASEERSGSEI